MLDLMIPLISATSGRNNDGVLIGEVRQTNLVSAISNNLLAPTVHSIRKDNTPTGNNFIDLTTQANAGITDNYQPFGATADMTANDQVFIGCDHEVKEIYVDVSTAGVWSGNGFTLWDSSDGVTANRQLTGVVDNSNGFRNAGVFRISWTHPPTDSVSFTPVPVDIESRRWIVIKLNGFTGVTTAPKLRRVYIIHDDVDVTYVDNTAIVNGSLTVSPTAGSYFPLPGSLSIFGFSNLAYGLEHYLFTAQSNVQTYAHEYLASDGTWKPLANWVDPSSDFSAVPTTSPQQYSVRWTIPTDWTSQTLTLPMGTGNQNFTGYFIRYRTTVVNTLGPTATPLYRSRGRVFGVANAYGERIPDAVTFKSLTFNHGVPSLVDMTLSVINANTGSQVNVVFPANIAESGQMAAQYIPMQLSFSAGDSMILAWAGGGSTTNTRLNFA